MSQFDLAVVIPAQQGGNDILRNALEPFGKDKTPLIIWKIRQLKKVIDPDRIYVSTFSIEIKKLVASEGVCIHDRARDFEQENLGDIGAVIEDIASGIDHEHLAWVSPVVPFMNEYDYQAAFDLYQNNVIEGDYDCLFSANSSNDYYWDEDGPLNYQCNAQQEKRRDLRPIYKVTNGLFIRSRRDILDDRYYVGIKPYKQKLSKLASFDIDAQEDLDVAFALDDLYRKKKNERESIIFLDFDGVIFDSVVEAYAIALLTSHKISKLSEMDIDTDHAKRFFSQRYLIGPAWNYYYLLKAIEDNEDKNFADYLPSEQGIEGREFQTAFFATRQVIRNHFWEEWLALNKMYPGSEYFIELINNNKNIVILTTKDKATVDALLIKSGVSRDIDIFDAQSYQEYGSKSNFINEYIKNNGIEKALFVDDSKTHLDKCSWVEKLSTIQAKWGYVADGDKEDNKQEVFSEVKGVLN